MKTVSVCGQINSEEEIAFMQFRDYQLFNSSDVRYIHGFNNGRIPKEALNDAAMQQNEKNNKVIYYPFG
jgi:hypothetical protein